MNCELCNHPAGLCKVVTTSSTGGVIEQTLCSACYDRLRRYLYARRERLGGAKQKPLWHTVVPANLELGGEVKPYGQDAPCKFFRSFLVKPGDEEPHHVLCGLSRVPIESCRCNGTCKEYAHVPGTVKIGRRSKCKE